jgi:hypothetical protein
MLERCVKDPLEFSFEMILAHDENCFDAQLSRNGTGTVSPTLQHSGQSYTPPINTARSKPFCDLFHVISFKKDLSDGYKIEGTVKRAEVAEYPGRVFHLSSAGSSMAGLATEMLCCDQLRSLCFALSAAMLWAGSYNRLA